MSKPELDLLGRVLMTQVRDSAILDWKKILDGRMKGERAPRIRAKLSIFSGPQRDALVSLIPEVVDTVLHHLLWTMEQDNEVALCLRDGGTYRDLRDVSDGLAGELYTDEGWIAHFSEEK